MTEKDRYVLEHILSYCNKILNTIDKYGDSF